MINLHRVIWLNLRILGGIQQSKQEIPFSYGKYRLQQPFPRRERRHPNRSVGLATAVLSRFRLHFKPIFNIIAKPNSLKTTITTRSNGTYGNRHLRKAFETDIELDLLIVVPGFSIIATFYRRRMDDAERRIWEEEGL
jgi:hypothetical protein